MYFTFYGVHKQLNQHYYRGTAWLDVWLDVHASMSDSIHTLFETEVADFISDIFRLVLHDWHAIHRNSCIHTTYGLACDQG